MKNTFYVLLFCLGLAVGFNNCSKGFEVRDAASQLSSAASDPTAPSTTVPVPPSSESGSMPKDFSASSLKVCSSGCDFTAPSQALAVAKDGDVIEVKEGDYVDCLSVHQSHLTIRGVGSLRPHLHSKLCDDKGIVVNYGAKNRFENLELSDFSNDSYNGAAVREDALAKDVILSNLQIHSGQMGLLGGSAGDHIWLLNSNIQDVGFERPDGEISVPVFVTAGDLLFLRGAKISRPRGAASLVKTRALETFVDCSTLANLESPDSYTLDAQTGGKISITASVLEQSDATVNSTMMAVNTVGVSSGIDNSLLLRGNIFLNDANRGTMIRYDRQGPSAATVENNIFVGAGTVYNQSSSLSASNQVLSQRSTEMGAYPSLPTPGNCTTAVPQF